MEPNSTVSMNGNLHTNTHVPKFSCKYFRNRLSKQTNKRNTFLYLSIRGVGAGEEFRDKQASLFSKFKARTLDLNFGYVPPGADECLLMHFCADELDVAAIQHRVCSLARDLKIVNPHFVYVYVFGPMRQF